MMLAAELGLSRREVMNWPQEDFVWWAAFAKVHREVEAEEPKNTDV